MNNQSNELAELISHTDLEICSRCGLPIEPHLPDNLENSRITASGKPFHLKCFTCLECGIKISDGYSQIEDETSPIPLIYCKTHYYEKTDLICAKCNEPLEGLFVTGLGKKYHPTHFTCAVCTTQFGPDGTYYEYQGKAYCLNHYTYLVSSKCSGCRQPIMKLYLQIYSTESNSEERWHPECYMIHKFWNVRINPAPPNSKNKSILDFENQTMIKEPQIYQIWTVLSSFEESTAACISDMLLQVSTAMYIEGLRQAERFIMHLDVLFTAIDDLEDELSQFDDSTGLQHTREPKLLCKKIVTFFSVISNNQASSASNGLTQELLTLVTSLAHYLKVLIRVALKGALKAEIEYNCANSTTRLLNKLSETSNRNKWNLFRLSYQKTDVSSDLCASCKTTIESESIVHFKSLSRWHLDCFNCSKCNTEMQHMYPSSYYNPDHSAILCPNCGENTDLPIGGFKFVSQLEQYSFLMRVALKRLYSLLKYRSYIDVIDGRYVCEPNKAPNQVPNSSRDLQQSLDYPKSSSQTINSPDASKSETHSRPRAYGRKNSLRETLEEVAAKRGVKNLKKTTKEDADYAFDVALQNIDDKIDSKATYIRRNNAIEEVEAMGSRLKSTTTDQQQHANADRRKSRVNVVTAQTIQARMKQAQPGSLDIHSRPVKSSSGSEKPKQLQRIKKPSGDRNDIKDPKLLNKKLPPPNNSPPKAAKTVPIKHSSSSNVNEGLKPINHSTSLHPPHNTQPLSVPQHAASKPVVPKLLQNLRNAERKPAKFMNDLTANELVFARFAAAARLSAFIDPNSTLTNGISSDLLALVGITKKSGGSLWNKLRSNLKTSKPGRRGADKDKEKDRDRDGDKDRDRDQDRDRDNKSPKQGTFGVPVDLLIERQGIETTLGSRGEIPLNIPRFFESMIKTLSEMDLTIEGIFRKNGNIRRLREVTLAVDKDDQSVDLTLDNSVQVAALLKKFLREIPEPLIPFKMRKIFLDLSGIKDLKQLQEALQCAILLLPQPNRDMLNVLLTFLQSVATYSALSEGMGSKMDTKNLGTVIAPNILYPDIKESTKDDVHFKATNDIITFIIENAPTIWQVPSSISNFLLNHSSNLAQSEPGASNTSGEIVESGNIDLDIKELMRRCTAAGLFNVSIASDPVPNGSGEISTKKAITEAAETPTSASNDVSFGVSHQSFPDTKASNFENNNTNNTNGDSSSNSRPIVNGIRN